MSENESNTTATVQPSAVATPAAKPVRKKAPARKPRTLSLPTPYNANHVPNLQLVAGMKDRFTTLELHKRTGNSKPVTVLENKDLGHLVQFIAALVTSYTSGSGIASDGCSMYVAEYAGKVLATVPELKSYDLVFVTSQSGPAKNRIPVMTLIEIASQRAGLITSDIKRYGLTKPSTRKSSKKAAPVIRAL